MAIGSRYPEKQRFSPHPVANILNREFTEKGYYHFEGLDLVWLPYSKLEAGDIYLAGRNVKPFLLTVKEVDYKIGCVFAQELNANPYNIGECYKVRLPFGQ